MTRVTQARGGFSLVEVLCALAVLSVGVIGLATGLTTALRESKESERATRAALFAQGMLESLQADRFLTVGEEEGDLPAALGALRWRRTIEAMQPEGLHHVVASVVDAKTGAEIVSLETLLFDPPLRTSTIGFGSASSSATGVRKPLEATSR